MNDLVKEINSNIINVQDFPKKGISYKDISPIFLNSNLCKKIVKALAELSEGKVDAVCGIESRGFLFGVQIAQELGIPFILIRKAGKLPPPVISKDYDLEYNKATIEVKKDYIQYGQRILIHDDVLATGGTANACADLVKECGGIVSQFSFLAILSFLKGEKLLGHHTKEIHSLVSY